MSERKQPVSHALQLNTPLDGMRLACGIPAKRAPKRDTLAANRRAATCPGCKAVVDLEPRDTFGEPPSMAAYAEWANGPDSGISSKTILSAITGVNFLGRWSPSVPWDAADFGRCYRLLQRFPELRARLGEVATKHPEWSALVDRWDEIARLFESEQWAAVYRVIRECTGRV